MRGGQPWWRSIYILVGGVAVALIVVGLAPFFVGGAMLDWFWPGAATPLGGDGRPDPEARTALELSFAQAWGGALALVLAGGLGLFAIAEFRRGQARPELALLFDPSGRAEATIRRSSADVAEWGLVWFAVVNTGTAVGRWWQAEVRIPAFPHPSGVFLSALDVRTAVIQEIGGSWTARPVPETLEVVLALMSQGQAASFLGQRLVVLECYVVESVLSHLVALGPRGLTIPYTIWTDRDEPRRGTLRLVVTDDPMVEGGGASPPEAPSPPPTGSPSDRS